MVNPLTDITAVQGPGEQSPLLGQAVTVRGVVTGDFQGDAQLRGFFIQQPVPDHDIAGMARVRREANAVGLPIMADESVLDHASLIRIIRADAADLVKVKVMKQGGFLNTRRMIATAEAAGEQA